LKTILLILLLNFSFFCKAQEENHFYTDAYQTIHNMLASQQKYSSKTAMFSVENTFEQGKLNTIELDQKIKFLANFSKKIIQNRDLNYTEKDKETVSKYASIFTIICEQIPIIVGKDTLKFKSF
jgi:hypothetical protein